MSAPRRLDVSPRCDPPRLATGIYIYIYKNKIKERRKWRKHRKHAEEEESREVKRRKRE
jgi:hypothetical protein